MLLDLKMSKPKMILLLEIMILVNLLEDKKLNYLNEWILDL